MTLPLVSIAIITYNSGEFIKECLDSVIAQDYPNKEIIVSDDASNDNTADILIEYKNKYPELIKVNINSSNLGITKNFNVTLAMSNGKYIAFLGGDDLMLPQKISKQVEYMEAHPDCTISYHDLEVFFSQASSEKSYLHHQSVVPRNGDVRVSIKHGPFNAGSASMVRKDKIPSYGYDERIQIASDGLFWIETLENGGKICYINEVLGRYRIHGNNVSRSKCSEMALDYLFLQSKLLTKYPEYARDILRNYSDSLFLLAKHNIKSIHYLKAAFKINKSFKIGFIIFLYYISLGKLGLNSRYMHYINYLYVKFRIYFIKLRQ